MGIFFTSERIRGISRDVKVWVGLGGGPARGWHRQDRLTHRHSQVVRQPTPDAHTHALSKQLSKRGLAAPTLQVA